MKKKYLTILSIIVITILSACGPAPTPTLTSEEISNTAIANAWISITQTQAAMPTATATSTLPPPTQPPLPVVTIPPTIPPATIASVDSTGGAATPDPCNQPPVDKPKGATVKVKFVNKSGGLVNLSFGMNTPNAQKECFTYSYTLGVFDEPVVTVLAGCYWGYAWITGKKPSVARTGSTILCLSDPNKTPPIWITQETIYFH